MLFAVTVFVLPTVFDANVAVPDTVNTSPATRLSIYVTLALVFPSYVLLLAVMVTASVLTVMLAVVVAVVFCE